MASKKTIRILQVFFLVLILAASVRVIIIMRERREPAAETSKPTSAPPLNREAYVVPKKLYISSCLRPGRQSLRGPNRPATGQ